MERGIFSIVIKLLVGNISYLWIASTSRTFTVHKELAENSPHSYSNSGRWTFSEEYV